MKVLQWLVAIMPVFAMIVSRPMINIGNGSSLFNLNEFDIGNELIGILGWGLFLGIIYLWRYWSNKLEKKESRSIGK